MPIKGSKFIETSFNQKFRTNNTKGLKITKKKDNLNKMTECKKIIGKKEWKKASTKWKWMKKESRDMGGQPCHMINNFSLQTGLKINFKMGTRWNLIK